MDQNAYGYTFEFGRGKSHTINEVAKMFNINPTYKEDKPGEALETLANYSLAKEVLDWEPKINLEDYISKQILTH